MGGSIYTVWFCGSLTQAAAVWLVESRLPVPEALQVRLPLKVTQLLNCTIKPLNCTIKPSNLTHHEEHQITNWFPSLHLFLCWILMHISFLCSQLCVCDFYASAGSEQSKEVIFPRSPSPSFLTVPGEGFAEPFALTPGKWIIHIRAEGILLVSPIKRHWCGRAFHDHSSVYFLIE